jgi:hypothetical protein
VTTRTSALTALPFVLCGCAETEARRVDAPPQAPVVVETRPAPAKAVKAARAPTLPPLPPDQAPARLGTQETSRAAAPWWGDTVTGYAPQSPRAWSLFEAAERTTREAGSLGGEMLACAVSVVFSEQKFSPFGDGVAHGSAAADLTTRLGFGARVDVDHAPLLEVKGPEDRNEMRFTAPVVALRPAIRSWRG